MTSSLKFAGAITALALAVPLAGCATSDEPADDGVTLQVAIDAGLDDGAIAAFEERAAQFESEHPDITIESVEYTWDGTTFAAALAGGTLPDVFTIPFTDGRGLIANQQIADISKLVADLPYAGDFNPNVAVAGQAADGSQWAVPIAAYGQGLHYNRTLFEQAGLDPDQPPTTWDEVRADAKQIADATGVAGYAQMTSSNTGGWILTTLDYALGGRLEQVDGDEVTSTIDTPEMKQVLDMVKTMRWQDDSMGANFLYDWGSINQAFASGQIGMYVSGGGNYGNLFTQNQMNPDDYGLTVLPLADDGDAGVLGGGTLAVVSANATEAEQAAGVKWIDFYYMQKLADEDAAVTAAKTTAESGAPVGAPEMPIFDEATYAESQQWIADYVNVPLDQMTPFTDHIFEQPLLPEPSHKTQEIYALLDPVVQAVLTDQNADIAKLLADAEQQAQQILAG
ncbi:ABC transporter substrate-binding protein [Agromyces larvae]|uniref:Sugar ABC transporter substrate-binding protein n=1 Tax=Agromyces larvae TaxID=2929802 RepID=A0ABY4C1H0_9MICO|nr:sugar ABC transporter substrate-binding protein [Agromyces larvae]UOE43811.1 sugar ABC transporter substrate-binding protein [Agromyces larvae]